jgi:hypothetical protein
MTNYKNTAHSTTGPSASPMDAGAGNTQGSITMRVVSNPLLNPANDSVVNLETSPDNTTWTVMGSVRGDGWCIARSDHRVRSVRSNVVNLGTGGAGLSAVVVSTP